MLTTESSVKKRNGFTFSFKDYLVVVSFIIIFHFNYLFAKNEWCDDVDVDDDIVACKSA